MFRIRKGENFYLKENRLSDVIALIQLLAFDNDTHRSVNGLERELQGKPKSADAWNEIAENHAEFFRFNKEKHNQEGADSHTISLVARHPLKRNAQGVREFSPDFTKKLLETAIQLHDKQKERADKWKVWLPLLIALITVISSFYVQYTSNQNQKFLKHYEVQLKPKQEGYVGFMKGISRSFFSANDNNKEVLTKSIDDTEISFFIFEPFLPPVEKEKIWEKYHEFVGLCYQINSTDSVRLDVEKTTSLFRDYKNYFRTNLHKSLFSSESLDP